MSGTANHALPLTRSERAIVALLREREGLVVSAADIVTWALGYVHPGSNPGRMVRVHISNIRAKGVEVANAWGDGYYVGTRRPAGPEMALCPACGAEFVRRTHSQQLRPWDACPRHRDARYQRAKASLERWRRRCRAGAA